MPAWDEDVRRAAFTRFGRDRMGAIDYFEHRAQVIAETSGRVRDGWCAFTLLHPANGPPSAVDRGNVWIAAISVLDHIALLGYGDPAEAMDALGVLRGQWESVDGEAPFDDCGLIRNWR